MKQGDLIEVARSLSLPLSEQAVRRLVRFEELLAGRGLRLGVLSRFDAERIRERHILDCLRAVPEIPDRGIGYDLGTGGGLPGIVVAIAKPEFTVGLVERRRRKIAFVEFAVDELGLRNAVVLPLPAEILGRDPEGLGLGPADACLARAFASPEASWQLARPLLASGGRLVHFLGTGVAVPPRLPGCSEIEVKWSSVLESAGPLAIMTRE